MNLACPHLIRLTDAGPVLLGSRCAECDEHYFPQVGVCTRCCSTQIEVAELGRDGTLWSWTIQGFQPKPPYDGGRDAAAFEPYGVGYVEMPCGTKVESRLTSADETHLRIGMPMRLVLEPYRILADGQLPLYLRFRAGAATVSDVAIIGIGLSAFGRHESSGLDQGVAAVRAALADAGISWNQVGIAYGGSQDAGNADAIGARLGLTGIPFINVANGCATGGSSLVSVVSAIRSGSVDIGVAVGFDKHPRGAFNAKPRDWGLEDWYGETGLMLTTQFFALKTRRYLHEHGVGEDALVRVAERAFRNGALTPTAWRREVLSFEQIANSTPVNPPLRKYMFRNPAEGGAALVLCRTGVAHRYTSTPILLKSVAVRTRSHGSFEVFAPGLQKQIAESVTVSASRAAFDEAGVGPRDIDVIQIQDTDSGTEIIHMAENGFCEHGEQGRLLESGATEIGGRLPINTDGGCLANGEPVGASGLRQVYEVCMQLRGQAGARQVPGRPQLGYTQVYGAPGVSGVTILQR